MKKSEITMDMDVFMSLCATCNTMHGLIIWMLFKGYNSFPSDVTELTEAVEAESAMRIQDSTTILVELLTAQKHAKVAEGVIRNLSERITSLTRANEQLITRAETAEQALKVCK